MIVQPVTVISAALVIAWVAGASVDRPFSSQVQPPPRQQRLPPRDGAAEERRGTATLRGRVVAADSGRALRRARVTISAPELGTGGRTTSTGLDGRYEFKELPAARYRVSVTRGGYLSLDYGQRRPGEIGRPIQLADGEVLEKIDFSLPRMGVISGRISDETGDPIEGVTVLVLRSMFYEGRRRLVPVGSPSVRTDETGEYRVRRLSPGTYVVMGQTKETWTVVEDGRETVFGYMPTYFPGIAKAADARRVTIGFGQEAGATDFSLVPGRAATISGQALDSKGRPFSNVDLSEEIRGLEFASFSVGPPVTVNPDGTFIAKNVPPGEYTLAASRHRGSPDGEPEAALMTIVVEGADIENLMLAGSSGGTIKGRIVVEGATPPKFSAIHVSVAESLRNQPSPTVLGAFDRAGSGRVQEDGTFTVVHVFGRARFQVSVPEGWMLKAVMHDGRDITDTPLELASHQELDGVEMIVTDRVTKMTGRVTDEKSQPVRDATVLVFPADSDKWFENSRAVRAARPDQQGLWEAKNLRAGDYLVVALEYVEDGAWHDPDFLESLRDRASAVRLAEGGSEVVSLKLVLQDGR